MNPVRDRLGLGRLDDGRPRDRIFSHVHRTAADDRTAAGASTKFRESHSYRHDTHPVLVLASDQMDQPK
jgi:hypothetical protein